VQFPDPKVAVVALIADGDRVLLVRRGVAPRRGAWALPGGFLDAGELPHEALRREVREETGLEILVGELLDLYPLEHFSGAGGFVMAFAASLLPAGPDADFGPDGARSPQPMAADDVTDARWFSADNLPDDLAFASTGALLHAFRSDPLIFSGDGAPAPTASVNSWRTA
jgi:ADP-ribose pyrophosphatase YjhB (NUDIX family)